MSSLPKVAVAGAGNLGIPIIRALLNSKQFHVTVFSRSANSASSYTGKLPEDSNLGFTTVDYASEASLTEALKDHFAVVSTLSTVDDQKDLVNAAVAAKVTRFIPSEFGSDTTNPIAATLPVYKGKITIAEMVEGIAKQYPSFTWTALITGPFFDWGLENNVFLNIKSRSGTLYNSGSGRYSVSLLDTIGKAVVAILNDLDATKNRILKIHDAVITQNKVVEIAKKADGKPWDLKESTTDKVREEAYATLERGNKEEIRPAMLMFLFSCIFSGDECGNDFSKTGVDNELLGITGLTDEEVEEVVKRYL